MRTHRSSGAEAPRSPDGLKRWEEPEADLEQSSRSRAAGLWLPRSFIPGPGREVWKLLPSIWSLGKTQSKQAHKTYLNLLL